MSILHIWSSYAASACAPSQAGSRGLPALTVGSSCSAALFGNLGGVTSGLLALDGGRLAGRARLDVIIPVAGFKRCADYDNGYGATQNSILAVPWCHRVRHTESP